MEVALFQPERTLGLFLVNSAGFIRYPRFFETLGTKVLRPSVVGTMMLGLAPLFLRRIFSTSTPETERFVEQVFGRISSSFAYDFAEHAHPLLPDLVSDVLDRIPELTLPMHVVWGDKDELLDYERVKAALARLPDAEVEVFRGCGHMPNLEAPERLSAAILRFYDKLERRGLHAGGSGRGEPGRESFAGALGVQGASSGLAGVPGAAIEG
jgi:pimeloyl-ACP methyl ester carboxylesterase